YHFIRWIIEQGSLKITYCPTDKMITDVLTKALPSTKVKHFAPCLGLLKSAGSKKPTTGLPKPPPAKRKDQHNAVPETKPTAVQDSEAVSRTKHVWYSEHGMYCRFEIILERAMSATHVAVIPRTRTHSDKEEFPKK
ncbi:hypothetical protein SCLCIDRAFT_133927, partial [Scleroderma citrinum Foug A]